MQAKTFDMFRFNANFTTFDVQVEIALKEEIVAGFDRTLNKWLSAHGRGLT